MLMHFLCRCKCGAANCRGTMDTRPDRLKDAYRRIEVFWEGDGTFYKGTVLGYIARYGLHIIEYDDGERAKENLKVSVSWSISPILQISSITTFCSFRLEFITHSKQMLRTGCQAPLDHGRSTPANGVPASCSRYRGAAVHRDKSCSNRRSSTANGV